MKKALAGIITTLFVLGGIGFAQSAVATPIPTAALAGVTGATLSPVGERAVEDVRRCLSSSDVLNVFYLIDNSGSLAATPRWWAPALMRTSGGSTSSTRACEVFQN